MSTRQLRLTSIAQIKKHLDRLPGKKVNLVLSDSTVVFGEIAAIESDNITVINGRLQKNLFPLTQVTEIYFDIIV